MDVTRREAAGMTAATLLLTAVGARAATTEMPDALISSDQPPKNLDPHQVYDVPMQGYALNAYDTLFRYEGNPPKLLPWLALSYSAAEDGVNWEFKLRPGCTFHDGSAVTAQDVVYSFQRVLGLGKGPAGAFLPVLKPAGVTAPDGATVRFKLEHPYAPFLAAIPLVSIVNPRVLKPHEKNGDWAAAWLASAEAGSGAYSFEPKTYLPLQRLDLKRYEQHFMGWKDNPRPVAAIAYRPITETSTRILALLKGTVDWTDSYLPVDDVAEVEKSKISHVQKNPNMRIFLIRMNNTKPPFDNANARKGFAHAFDYQGFIQQILKGYAQRDPTPLPNTLWAFPKDVKGYDYDLKKAKAYFDKARQEGAPLHRPVQLHIQEALAQTSQAAQLFQSSLAEIGINLKIVNDTWPNLTTSTSQAATTPDMWIHWVSTYFVDPENWIGQMYDSRFHGTWKASCWYKNAKVDALLDQGRRTIGEAARKPLYDEATRLVVADSPDIWIYNTVDLRGINNRVEGFRYCPVGGGTEVRWIHLKA
jgi:peptide/nickel transport system substrate-binding protein